MDRDQLLHRLQMVINAAHEAAMQIHADKTHWPYGGVRIATPHGHVIVTEDGDIAVNPSHHHHDMFGIVAWPSGPEIATCPTCKRQL